MTKQMNLRLDEDLIKEFEELAEEENLDRSSLVRKILIEGLQQERLNVAIQKYTMKEIANLSMHEFIHKLTELSISSNLTAEDYKKIL
ncbi:MAG: ribbon-helix-helix protein, CopG family [Promethearchaeia archaeon]